MLPPDSEPIQVPERIRDLAAQGAVALKPPPRTVPEPVEMLPGEKSAVDYVLEQRQ
jgi:hypothetical protein